MAWTTVSFAFSIVAAVAAAKFELTGWRYGIVAMLLTAAGFCLAKGIK